MSYELFQSPPTIMILVSCTFLKVMLLPFMKKENITYIKLGETLLRFDR